MGLEGVPGFTWRQLWLLGMTGHSLLQVLCELPNCRELLKVRRCCNSIFGKYCGALNVALESMKDVGGYEAEETVVAETVDITLDFRSVKADEVEESGADRRKSNIWLRWGYAIVEGE